MVDGRENGRYQRKAIKLTNRERSQTSPLRIMVQPWQFTAVERICFNPPNGKYHEEEIRSARSDKSEKYSRQRTNTENEQRHIN